MVVIADPVDDKVRPIRDECGAGVVGNSSQEGRVGG